eukprot:scaffold13607_cov123-Isochrysis_galbana.AAC.1
MGTHLRVEVIRQLGHVLRLDGQLLVEQRQVVLQLRVGGKDDAHTLVIGSGDEAWPASAAKHLHHVHHGELCPGALLGRVDLGEGGRAVEGGLRARCARRGWRHAGAF